MSPEFLDEMGGGDLLLVGVNPSDLDADIFLL